MAVVLTLISVNMQINKDSLIHPDFFHKLSMTYRSLGEVKGVLVCLQDLCCKVLCTSAEAERLEGFEICLCFLSGAERPL